MKRNEWMTNEIASWRKDGVIDADLAAKLAARYPVSDGRISLGTALVGAFGAMLVGLGVIALFAANWDEFGRPARAAISVAPVVFCALGAAYAALRGTKSAAVWEPLGVIWAISIAAAASLVAQTYQVGGSVQGLVLLVALLTLPVAWVAPSATLMSLWPIYPVVWTFAKCDEIRGGNCHLGVFACAVALMALSVPAYVSYLKRRGERGPFAPVQFVTGVVYSVGLALILMRSFIDCGCDAWPYVYSLWAGAALVGVAGKLFKLPVWPWVATAVASCAAFAFGIDNDPGNYVISLAFAAGVIAYGIRSVRLAYVNLGSILAIWLVLAKFFASNISFTAKGVVLVVCGVALTAANVAFMRFAKSRRVSK